MIIKMTFLQEEPRVRKSSLANPNREQRKSSFVSFDENLPSTIEYASSEDQNHKNESVEEDDIVEQDFPKPGRDRVIQ